MKILVDLWSALGRAVKAVNAFADLFEHATDQGKAALEGRQPIALLASAEEAEEEEAEPPKRKIRAR